MAEGVFEVIAGVASWIAKFQFVCDVFEGVSKTSPNDPDRYEGHCFNDPEKYGFCPNDPDRYEGHCFNDPDKYGFCLNDPNGYEGHCFNE